MVTKVDKSKVIDDWLAGETTVMYDWARPGSIVIRAKG
jgi:hypothetical protein